MKGKKYKYINILVVLMLFSIVLFFGCNNSDPERNELQKAAKTDITKNDKHIDYAVELPPFSDGIFPCTSCHAGMEPNPEKRELFAAHDSISSIFNHDKENRWCTDCHDLKNRDSLRLANGKLLDFKESYKLCGQCHGEKLRDWKVGVHGKRTGEWNGKKKYFLCVNCHNPHSPKFKPRKPELPPIKQEDIK